MENELTQILPRNEKNDKFCFDLADNINKDYPNGAVVKRTSSGIWVYLNEKYKKMCEDYVLSKCKLRV